MSFTILNLSVTAKYFGISLDKDLWILALNGIMVIDMALWGPFNETFRAKFVFFQHEIGTEKSIEKARSIFTFINVVTIFIVVIICVFPRLITSILAPDYNETELQKLDFMMMVIAPSFLFNQASQFLISILNAYNVYYIPEITNLVSSGVNILLVIFLAPALGIYSLMFGYYLGIFLLVGLLFYQLRKKRVYIIGNPFNYKFSDVKPFILFALPFFVPYFIGQISSLVEKAIASTFHTGAVSSVDYSRKFSEIAITVLSSVYTTMLLPVLSQNFARKDQAGYLKEFNSIFQLSFLIVAVMIGLFTACPGAFIDLLYNKGNITAAGLLEISQLSTLYCWSALPIVLYMIFGIVLVSSDKGKIYALYGSLAQVLMIVMNYSLKGFLGIYTFAVSAILSHFIVAIILFSKFPFNTKSLANGFAKGLGQIFLSSAILYTANHFINWGGMHSLLIIIFNTIALVSINVAYAFIIKTEDRFLLIKLYNSVKGFVK